MIQTVDINPEQSGALQSRGQISQACPTAALEAPSQTLSAFCLLGWHGRQTVPGEMGRNSPGRHMQPTEACNTAHAGGKWPTAWQGCACHTPSGRAGQPEDSLPRLPSESWSGSDTTQGLWVGPPILTATLLPVC